MKTSVVIFLLHLTIELAQSDSDWDYLPAIGHVDPPRWHVKYRGCNGRRQSPIHIRYADLHYDPDLGPLAFHGYEEPIRGASLINDGHTIRFELPSSSNVRLRSKSLDAEYRLKQFHFHWSHRDDTGSEHVIDSRHFPMELHFVHVPVESASVEGYENQTSRRTTNEEEEQHEANDEWDRRSKRAKTEGPNSHESEPQSIVVLVVMFQVVEEGEPGACKELQKIVDMLPKVEAEGSHVRVDRDLKINSILPQDTQGYIRYSGSLTTPPCSEVVEWILLTRTLNVSRSQMDQFRSIKHSIPVRATAEHLTNTSGPVYLDAEVVLDENVRPLQNLNHRLIRLRRDVGDLFPGRRLPRISSKANNRKGWDWVHAIISFCYFFFAVQIIAG